MKCIDMFGDEIEIKPFQGICGMGLLSFSISWKDLKHINGHWDEFGVWISEVMMCRLVPHKEEKKECHS